MKEIISLYEKNSVITDENLDEIKSNITHFLDNNKSPDYFGFDTQNRSITNWLQAVLKKSVENKDFDFASRLSSFKAVGFNALIVETLQKPRTQSVELLLEIKKAKKLGWNFKGYEMFEHHVDLKTLPINTTEQILAFCDINDDYIAKRFFDYSMKSFDNDDLEKILINLYFKTSYYPDKNQEPASKNKFITGRFSRNEVQFNNLLNHLEFTQYDEKDYCKLYNVKTLPSNVLTPQDVKIILEDKQFHPQYYDSKEHLKYQPKIELFLERQKIMLEQEKLTIGQSFDGDEKFQKLVNQNNKNVEYFLDIVRINCNIKVSNLVDATNEYFSLLDQANSISEIKYSSINWNDTTLDELLRLNTKLVPKMLTRLEDSFTLAEIKENKNEYLLNNQQEFLNDVLFVTRKVHAFINQIEAVEQITIQHKENKKSKI